MDVPMAVCTAVMIAKLRPVPPDEHGDLRRENMTSSMTVARSACLEVRCCQLVLHLLRATTTSCEDANWIPARPPSAAVQESSWIPMAMPPTAVRGAKQSAWAPIESQGFHYCDGPPRKSTTLRQREGHPTISERAARGGEKSYCRTR